MCTDMPAPTGPTTDSCKDCTLRGLRMFCNLRDEALQHLDKIGVQVRYPARVDIYQRGERARALHVLCSGHVKLFTTSREGKTMILKIAWPGDVLGLSAVLSQGNYEVTAETLEPCQVKTLRREEVLTFIDKFSEAGRHSLESMANEYQSAFRDARRLSLGTSAASRLANVLLDLARNASCSKPEMRFTMALTHEELGNLAGLSRETVTRLLGRFQREGLLRIKGSSITIADLHRLNSMTEA
jgi:CRP/FNR family transcriptional regulator, cyclic AMP receptor protein